MLALLVSIANGVWTATWSVRLHRGDRARRVLEVRQAASDQRARAVSVYFAANARGFASSVEELAQTLSMSPDREAFVARHEAWISYYVSGLTQGAGTALSQIATMNVPTEEDSARELELRTLTTTVRERDGIRLATAGFPYDEVVRQAEQIGFYPIPANSPALSGPEYKELLALRANATGSRLTSQVRAKTP